MRCPLVLTPGDPKGIGPEVAVAALSHLGESAVLVGEAAAIEKWAGPLPRIASVEESAGLCILEPVGEEPVEVAALRVAVQACLEGHAAALVTGPIHKASLVERGFAHRGHTEFLGELCGVPAPVMAFVGHHHRASLVTTHVPLVQVAPRITREGVLHVIRASHAFCVERLGLAHPRIAVCGLNPHAGEGGVLGTEELEHIGPACADAREGGIQVEGPVSAEAAFRWNASGRVDWVVGMYHDQVLAPLKLVEFGSLVNVTLGLPICRTSVDHGTARDIAGQGTADAASMVAAITLALRLVQSPHMSSETTPSQGGYAPKDSQSTTGPQVRQSASSSPSGS
jgi:4-hydroxythreonine-4-phosphate dehydrogenase